MNILVILTRAEVAVGVEVGNWGRVTTVEMESDDGSGSCDGDSSE